MKQLNKLTGKLGEEEARGYLRKKGFKILESNFSTRFGEIDIIAVDGKTLVFVEVKAKVGEDYGAPEEMINWSKINQIKKTSQSFLFKNHDIDKKYDTYRVDVVAVVFDKNKETKRLDHYENVDL